TIPLSVFCSLRIWVFAIANATLTPSSFAGKVRKCSLQVSQSSTDADVGSGSPDITMTCCRSPVSPGQTRFMGSMS
ncbi:MAG: hypothetical protein ACKVH1_03300, partial [Alphaproteobacteria bacterium]